MKLEITKKGYHDQSGKPVDVGTVITTKGDDIPAGLVNKCRVIAESKGKTAVTNPAQNAQGSETQGAGE